MRRKAITLMLFMLFTLETTSMVLPALQDTLYAQRAGGGGGSGGQSRSAQRGSDVNRSSPSRSGSTSRSSGRSSPNTQTRAGGGNQGRQTGPSARNNNNRRSASRNRSGRSTRNRRRTRSRRVHRSRRFRRGPWIHHAFFHPWGFYRRSWVGLVFISTAAFVTISSQSTTYTYTTVTYYHYNPWYKKVLHDGEEGYILTSAPVGHTVNELPDGAETIEVDGQTYQYAEWSFWQAASAGGYEVVEPPVGAEVSTIPEEAVQEEEGDVSLYHFDTMFFTQDTNDAGQTIYRVEPRPPEEEIDEIPADSPSFEADGETFYYVDFSFYVEYEENGKTGYTNGEPEIGAQVDSLPDGVTTVEEDGVTYYQFDTVFFEEVEDSDGSTFYEVVGSPDGNDEEVLN